MDVLRRVLYTLTYPVWYVLSLLVGSKERPPAIEDGCDEKYPLPPIEKFRSDELEIAPTKDDDIVKAFGEDLARAHFIDCEEEEDEDGDEEDDGDEAADDEGVAEILNRVEPSDDLLPDSVKRATDSLQREIEETMKLRDELKAAADRNLQRVEALTGKANVQRSDAQAAGKAPIIVENLIPWATAAAETLDRGASGVARTAQEGIDQVAEGGREILNRIVKETVHTGENLARSSQEELEDADQLLKTAADRSTSGEETLERLKAVEQAMHEDPEETKKDNDE